MTHIGNYAHVILPGTSFAEKDGTFTSMERRVQRVRKAIARSGIRDRTGRSSAISQR